MATRCVQRIRLTKHGYMPALNEENSQAWWSVAEQQLIVNNLLSFWMFAENCNIILNSSHQLQLDEHGREDITKESLVRSFILCAMASKPLNVALCKPIAEDGAPLQSYVLAKAFQHGMYSYTVDNQNAHVLSTNPRKDLRSVTVEQTFSRLRNNSNRIMLATTALTYTLCRRVYYNPNHRRQIKDGYGKTIVDVTKSALKMFGPSIFVHKRKQLADTDLHLGPFQSARDMVVVELHLQDRFVVLSVPSHCKHKIVQVSMPTQQVPKWHPICAIHNNRPIEVYACNQLCVDMSPCKALFHSQQSLRNHKAKKNRKCPQAAALRKPKSLKTAKEWSALVQTTNTERCFEVHKDHVKRRISDIEWSCFVPKCSHCNAALPHGHVWNAWALQHCKDKHPELHSKLPHSSQILDKIAHTANMNLKNSEKKANAKAYKKRKVNCKT